MISIEIDLPNISYSNTNYVFKLLIILFFTKYYTFASLKKSKDIETNLNYINVDEGKFFGE